MLQFLCSVYPLSSVCLEYIRKIVRCQPVKKGDVLLRIGEVSRRLYFIRKGLLHCYYFVDGKPVSGWFFIENDTVVSVGSYYGGTPSEDCIEVQEDGELYYITREQFDYLCMTFHDFSILASLLLSKYLVEFHEHARLIRKRRAEDRMDIAQERYPKLFARVPKKLIASWLGVERETLSRRPKRKNFSRKK